MGSFGQPERAASAPQFYSKFVGGVPVPSFEITSARQNESVHLLASRSATRGGWLFLSDQSPRFS